MKSNRSERYEMVVNDEFDHRSAHTFSIPPNRSSKLWSSAMTICLIGIYYVPSISLTFYQRWLYQAFHFPLITVLIHMMVKYLLASLVRLALAGWKNKKTVSIGWRDFIRAVGPVGIFGGLDIGFSNWGLALIQVSLYTMTKSTTIVFILAFSIFFKLEKKSWQLCLIIISITIGLILFTYEATNFNTFGFVLLLFASILSGLRWTCIQIVLQKSKMPMKNPIEMIYYMQPWMIISVLPFALWIEGANFITNCQLFRSTDYSQIMLTVFKVLLGAFIAFFMEITEMLVVLYTSSLTLAVAGICKEIFMVALAIEWNGDQLSLINVIGLILCLIGITSHVVHKFQNTTVRDFHSYASSDENIELSASLMRENSASLIDEIDDEEDTDSYVLFNILNNRDR